MCKEQSPFHPLPNNKSAWPTIAGTRLLSRSQYPCRVFLVAKRPDNIQTISAENTWERGNLKIHVPRCSRAYGKYIARRRHALF